MRNMKKFISAVFFAAYVLFAVRQAGAATFSVTTGDNSGAGSLRQAVESANANGEADIINISVKEIYLASSVAITNDLVVNGSGAAIRGSRTSRLFEISGGAVKFDSVTFTGGYPLSESGGAAYIDSSAASVGFVNCTFWSNSAGKSGGAVYVYGTGSRPTTFTNCTITNNEAAESGGGIAVAGGAVQFTASIVTGNKAPLDADVHVNGEGRVSNSSQYNVIGTTNALSYFAGSLHNDTSVLAADVFKTPESLSTIDGIGVMELLSATANKALDKIPVTDALSLALPGVDQRGQPRPKMSGIDAGSFELDPKALTGITLEGSSYIEVLTSENYTVSVLPEGATLDIHSYTNGLEWSVEPVNGSVISVDDKGAVSAVAAGSATLKVRAHGWDAAGNPVVKEASKAITVGSVPQEKPSVLVSIINKKTSMSLDEQHTLNLRISVFPEDNPYNVTFKSDAPAIATVTQTAANSASAVVKARYPGETMISVVVTASNSKGSAEPASDGYLLTVLETQARKSGGGGGCQAGGSLAGLAGFLVAAAFIIRKRR